MINGTTTLASCIAQIPGRILLVGMPVTQEVIDLGKDRAQYVTMAAVVSLAGWLDGVGGSSDHSVIQLSWTGRLPGGRKEGVRDALDFK